MKPLKAFFCVFVGVVFISLLGLWTYFSQGGVKAMTFAPALKHLNSSTSASPNRSFPPTPLPSQSSLTPQSSRKPPGTPSSVTNPSSQAPPDMMGYLNYDVWHWIMGYLVDDMRIHRDFPLYPDERKRISKLHTEFDEVDPADVREQYGHKIYGYLLPPQPGSYSFKVELSQMTAATSTELWISTNSSNPLNISEVLHLDYDDMSRRKMKNPTTKSKESKEMRLEGGGSYYFEFLEKAFEGKVVADVKWKTPSSGEYASIPSSCYAMAITLDGSGNSVKDPVTQFPLNSTTSLPSNRLLLHQRTKSVLNTIHTITDLHVLPECQFRALYKQVHYSKVFPPDATWFNDFKKKDVGNSAIDKNVAKKVEYFYNKTLNASTALSGSVISLLHLEETLNKDEGSRFLLEMEVQLQQPRKEIVYTSEYVYLKKGSSHLCHTSNFQWTKDVEVHLVVAVKNLGMWIRHLIFNMEDLYQQTGDEHFSLIVVDFESEDMNIKEEAKKSSFKRIHVLQKNGSFSRSSGLQAGIDHVTDSNSIVMAIDMHLTFPTGMINYIRKHTVQHKMALAPLVFKLNKGYTEINCNGMWGIWGFGLFSMYKSDWVKIGGFDTVKFTDKWGHEDVDVRDRSLKAGIEIFRIRSPGLVHYHHSKKGLWGDTDLKLKKWTLH